MMKYLPIHFVFLLLLQSVQAGSLSITVEDGEEDDGGFTLIVTNNGDAEEQLQIGSDGLPFLIEYEIDSELMGVSCFSKERSDSVRFGGLRRLDPVSLKAGEVWKKEVKFTDLIPQQDPAIPIYAKMIAASSNKFLFVRAYFYELEEESISVGFPSRYSKK